MKNLNLTILFLFFISLIYIGDVIKNKEKKITSCTEDDGGCKWTMLSSEEKRNVSYNDSVKEAQEAEIYYTNCANEIAPPSKDDSPEVIAYRRQLRKWLEWDNECMGMDPRTMPKDPRLKK